MNRAQKKRKAAARRAHALRLDNRRPAGSERLSVIRKREKEARRREAES